MSKEYEVKKVDIDKLSAEVDLHDFEKDKPHLIKVMREFSKGIGKNQFEGALILMMQFQELITLFDSFVRREELFKEFLDYLYDLTPDFLLLYKSYVGFSKELNKKAIQVFGGNLDG